MKTKCRLIVFLGFLVALNSPITFCQVSINSDRSNPHASAMLEVKSSNRGFLPPRVELSAVNSEGPIMSPAVGLLVFNTATSGTPPYNVTPGYYYWNGTSWISFTLPQATNPGDMLYWDGLRWVAVPLGSPGQVLQISQSGMPKWSGAAFSTLTTSTIASITKTSATSGGNVTNDGGATVTARGVCWSNSPNPLITGSHTMDGNGTGTFISNLTGLLEGTLYHVRAYATNSSGTAYGNEISFTTFKSDAITDIDGNYYNKVTIGTQVWMAENLKTTHYNDGTELLMSTDLVRGDYGWYNYDVSFKDVYGALYSWGTVISNKLCPTGWHVPAWGNIYGYAEWQILVAFLTNNGYGYGGSGDDIAKSMAAKSGWDVSSTPGTPGNDQESNNSSGFAGLPGGFQNIRSGQYPGFTGFFEKGTAANWWSSIPVSHIICVEISNYSLGVGWGSTNEGGELKSVRCILNSVPIVTKPQIRIITQTSIQSECNVSSDGGSPVTDKGLCWGTSINPTTADNRTTGVDIGSGTFITDIIGLNGGTVYYVRGYAINNLGTSYGEEISVTTLSEK